MPRLAPDALPDALRPILRRHLPGAEITDWAPAERGFSTETYVVTVQDADGTRKLVLRRPPELPLFPDYDLLRQVRVMRGLAGTGLPVPVVRWLDRDCEELSTPYYVMDYINAAGTPSDVPSYHTAGMYFDASPDERRTLWWACVDTIAAIHRLDWRGLGLGWLSRGATTLPLVDYIDATLHWASPSVPPPLLRTVDYLREHAYEPEHRTLCWGDARMSNILYDGDFGVAGVVDWEIAYLGDHEADLAWMLFLDWACSEYEGHPALPGTPGRDETIERYEQRTGWPIHHLRYNEVLAAAFLAVPLLRLNTHYQLAGNDDLTRISTTRINQLL